MKSKLRSLLLAGALPPMLMQSASSQDDLSTAVESTLRRLDAEEQVERAALEVRLAARRKEVLEEIQRTISGPRQKVLKQGDSNLITRAAATNSTAIAVGMGMDEVTTIMGKPSRIMNFSSMGEHWWYYQNSRIEFKGEKVASWENKGNNLKVGQGLSTPQGQQNSGSSSAASRIKEIEAQIEKIQAARRTSRLPDRAAIKDKGSGETLVLEDDIAFEVKVIDRLYSRLWMKYETIRIVPDGVDYLLINESNNEAVHARRVR